MIDKLYNLILGDEGFLLKLRCKNIFDEQQYLEIKRILNKLVKEWEVVDVIPKKGFLLVVELIEFLSRNSNFLSKEDFLKVEDASLEIKDIVNNLYLN